MIVVAGIHPAPYPKHLKKILPSKFGKSIYLECVPVDGKQTGTDFVAQDFCFPESVWLSSAHRWKHQESGSALLRT